MLYVWTFILNKSTKKYEERVKLASTSCYTISLSFY